MEQFAFMVLLSDFYGPLLTEKQRNIWDLHYNQDFSLVEIAEAEKISRQAVYDLLKRTEKILREYEEKLGLVDRFTEERSKLSEVKGFFAELSRADFASTEAWERMQRISRKIDDIFPEQEGLNP